MPVLYNVEAIKVGRSVGAGAARSIDFFYDKAIFIEVGFLVVAFNVFTNYFNNATSPEIDFPLAPQL